MTAAYFSSTASSLDDVDVHGFMRRLVKKTVSLLNYYKEIPVSYSAQLLDYDQKGCAILSCHPVQERLIEYDRYSILRAGPLALKGSLAPPREGEPAGHEVLRLHRFLPVEVYTDQRDLVRVTYDQPLDVTIWFGGSGFSAQMLDSSANAFRIKPVPELPMGFRDRGAVRFTLPLASGPTLIEAEAIMVKKTSEAQIFKMEVSRSQETAIMRYINQRQVEIIRELSLK